MTSQDAANSLEEISPDICARLLGHMKPSAKAGAVLACANIAHAVPVTTEIDHKTAANIFATMVPKVRAHVQAALFGFSVQL